ncbi:hypothetical protein MTsPCn9_09980 [Croceitalea sp. MTPC9]|nr:hypothetical protein MTsPCn5_37680 [Croceitalea sp. MTPC5]GMN11395.1 hypothetical protein MTsPCn6_27260 [Croceitalea sp. MTPC6]GMN16062.1 hypothetical protein MTsPCn9_09980 [Croceitalea sp. MTPC9]
MEDLLLKCITTTSKSLEEEISPLEKKLKPLKFKMG